MTTLALDDYFYRIWGYNLNDYKPDAFLDTVVFKGRTVSFPSAESCCLELKTSYIDSQLDTVFENDFIFFPHTVSLAFFDKEGGLSFLVGSANIYQDEYFRVGTTHNPLQALVEIISYVDRAVVDLSVITVCLRSFKSPVPKVISVASPELLADLEKEQITNLH